MPEIKHQFTGGKMNKDVDERLVPNGEYRDAMNIQVSTSEGSDVGTVQNILGNKLVDKLSFLSPNSTCVGAVADEKNDAFYWLVSEFTTGVPGFLGSLNANSPYEAPFKLANYILEHKNNNVSIVFTDTIQKRCFSTTNAVVDIFAGTLTFTFSSHNFSPGDVINTIQLQGSVLTDLSLLIDSVTSTEVVIQLGAVISLTGISSSDLLAIKNSPISSCHATKPSVLNFNTKNTVTGINIIDDMLFWTDDETEPKKINIPRCKSGTEANGQSHTRLLVKGIDKGLVREEHVTVIKKGPANAPTIISDAFESVEGFVEDLNFVKPNSMSSSFPSGVLLEEGEGVDIDVSKDFVVEEGQILRLNPEDDVINSFPETYLARVLVNDVTSISATQNKLTTTTLTLSPTIIPGPNNYNIAVENDTKILFERKFPRFACRYKYEDNEYSPIGPFSEVVFIPGNFDYHPTEAFNKGMVNTLNKLILQDFIPSDIPEDVVQVDLLYKNEVAPNVYVIQSVSEDDTLEGGFNAWTSPGSKDGLHGSYEVTTENIYAQLPSNQILRPWDNVPKTALAQEVTGNRIVYGNYTQGYDLKNPILSAELKVRNVDDSSVGKRSVKSLRTYNLGVVYGDKYGRETPVFTSSKANQLVPKNQASESNLLAVTVDSDHPSWADYYKIFIKETSNEYYNLAMDRLYDAKDGNVWISFPSIDRNKVDEDTYLILKKGVDDKGMVDAEARYKIVAIENEVPDYVKTTFTILAEPNLNINGYDLIGATSSGTAVTLGSSLAPYPGHSAFTLSVNKWNGNYNGSTKMGLPSVKDLFEDKGTNRLYVSFSNNQLVTEAGVTPEIWEKKESKRYLITSVKEDAAGLYEIQLSKPIPDSDSWITDNLASDFIDNGQFRPVFWKEETLPSAEFDGRFFVKIIGDSTVQNNLVSEEKIKDEFIVERSTNVYYLADNQTTVVVDTIVSDVLAPGSTNYPNSRSRIQDVIVHDTGYYNYTNAPPPYANPSPGSFQTPTTPYEWYENLKFGGTSIKGNWFIDKAAYAGEHPLHSNSTTATKTYFNGTYSALSVTTASPPPMSQPKAYGGSALSYWDGKSSGLVSREGYGGSNDSVDGPLKANYDFFTLSYSRLGSGYSVPYNPNEGLYMEWDGKGSEDAERENIEEKLTQGQKFRFDGDDNIYTIKGVTKRQLYNHTVMNSKDASTSTLKNNTLHTTQAINNAYWVKAGHNKRISYTVKYTIDDANSADVPTGLGLATSTTTSGINGTNPTRLEFVRPYSSDGENPISTNPAIFETEPKEDTNLDIYYEASNKIPTNLTFKNKYRIISVGDVFSLESGGGNFPEGTFVTGFDGEVVTLSNDVPMQDIKSGKLRFTKDDGSYVVVMGIPTGTITNQTNVTSLEVFIIGQVGLAWYNCWSFSNGVESNRIGDTFNKPYLTNGAKASTILDEAFEEERKKYGLIYSGIYNSTSGVNSLNQFIAAEKITKDINPIYGSIQKLHAGWGQGGDLVTLCEDRILKIFANKDALFNADGNTNITSTNSVLGQAIPYSGEYGISTDPESFASEAYRVYFTDRVRGTVMRLSMDGLTPISNHGMKDWFRDNLKLSNKLVGSYDDKKDEYNITLYKQQQKGGGITLGPTKTGVSYDNNQTVTFKEDVKGWVSFKSFIPENAISCANEYYTFLDGRAWKHHDETKPRNTFYGESEDYFTSSKLSVILNDVPGSIKSFNTLNYEGSQSKVSQNLSDDQYYNLSNKDGWFVNAITTDKEKGSINEFINKEGKWFNYIKGNSITHDPYGNILIDDNEYSDFDHASFAIQGLGILQQGTPPPPPPPNCALTATYTSQNNTVYSGSDGGITAVVSNGALPYTYSWTSANGYTASTATITGLVAGTYSLTATDEVGCTVSLTVNITEPNPPPAINMLLAVDQGATYTVLGLDKYWGKNPAANTGSLTNIPMASIAPITDAQGAPAVDGAVFIPPGPYSGMQIIKLLGVDEVISGVDGGVPSNWRVANTPQLGFVEPGELIPRYRGGVLPLGVSVLFNHINNDIAFGAVTVSVFYDNYIMSSAETIIEIPIELEAPPVL